jgi:hypothetical protein
VQHPVQARRAHQEVVHVAPRVSEERGLDGRGRRAQVGVDRFDLADHVGREAMAQLLDQRFARWRVDVAVEHVPRQIGLHLLQLDLGVLEEQPQLGDLRLELLLPRGVPGRFLRRVLPGADGAEVQHLIDGEEEVVERDARELRAVDVAQRAHARFAAIRLEGVEGDDQALDAIADTDRNPARPLEGDAVLRDVLQRAGVRLAGQGDDDPRAERLQLVRAVPVRPEEDLAALTSVELLDVALHGTNRDRLDRCRHLNQGLVSAAGNRTSNRAPPCGRSTATISPL